MHLDPDAALFRRAGTGRRMPRRILPRRSTAPGGAPAACRQRCRTTGADRDKRGLFEVADGGTLFLDEIGETSGPFQAKLLRALQEREVRPVGGTRSRAVDARVIAATNRDLWREGAAAGFRPDLYFRLAVFPIHIPPLRERGGDVLLLAPVAQQDAEILVEFDEATSASQMKLLATFRPTTKFGEAFQYSSLLAAAAGYTAAHVLYPATELGRGYDEAMRTRVFAPLGMKATTFDFARALRGNHATGHAWDVDARTAIATMDINRAIIPVRPAGGEWSSAREFIKYVQLELDGGKLPGGKQLVSRGNLLERRAPKVPTGETSTYGMGLVVDTKWGIPVVDHCGGITGYASNMLFLPDHGVGAVILTNSTGGWFSLDAFKRFLVEQLFDGKPEAEDDLRAAAKSFKETLAEERPRLSIPADPAEVAKLSRRYISPALGTIDVGDKGGQTIFDFKEWKSPVASHKNDDGTTSFVTIAPGMVGFQLVVGVGADGTRQLIMRDAQHEYVFVEAK